MNHLHVGSSWLHQRLLVTSTAKKREPVAGGPTTPSIMVSRLERWSSPTPFPQPPFPGVGMGSRSVPIQSTDLVSSETSQVDFHALRRSVLASAPFSQRAEQLCHHLSQMVPNDREFGLSRQGLLEPRAVQRAGSRRQV